MDIADHLFLPTLDRILSAIGGEKTGRAALSILYMAFQHARFALSGSYLTGTVGSYPTFSPLPFEGSGQAPNFPKGSYFLWHCLDSPEASVPLLAGYVALRCPDFPCLPRRNGKNTIARPA